MKRTKDANRLKILKEKYGCTKSREKPLIIIDEMFEVYRCPCAYSHPHFNLLITLYGQYKNGVMPDSGPLIDQPAWMIESFQVFQEIESDIKEEQDRKMKAQIARKN